MHDNEDHVLKILEEAGLVSARQIDHARARLNGSDNVIDHLVRGGVISADDISRSLAAQAQMHGWTSPPSTSPRTSSGK